VEHCGAEISNWFTSNKCNSSSPERFETALFRNGCLAFRSPPKLDLRLRLKSSMMSTSLQALPGDLYTATSSTSLLPIGMQTPAASTETGEGRSEPSFSHLKTCKLSEKRYKDTSSCCRSVACLLRSGRDLYRRKPRMSLAADNKSESRTGVRYTVDCPGRTSQARREANSYRKDARLIQTNIIQ
jgi:hypothetical protein